MPEVEDAMIPSVFTASISLDLSTVVPSTAGPKRPQDRVLLSEAASEFNKAMKDLGTGAVRSMPVEGEDYELSDGDVVIAAITSCTNTSNPSVLIAAGLVAWLGSAWPDLIVAFAIAGLFLHSSWMIIRDAKSDLWAE